MASFCSEKKNNLLVNIKIATYLLQYHCVDVCQSDNRALCISAFLSFFLCKITVMINFDNAGEPRYPAENNHLDYSLVWGIIFLFYTFSLPLRDNFLFPVSFQASFSHLLVKCRVVVFFFPPLSFATMLKAF